MGSLTGIKGKAPVAIQMKILSGKLLSILVYKSDASRDEDGMLRHDVCEIMQKTR